MSEILDIHYSPIIPEDWKKTSILSLGEFFQGCAFPESFQGIKNEKYPFYKVSDFNLKRNSKYLLEHNNSISEKTLKHLKGNLIPPKSIIFAKVGAALLINRRRINIKNCLIDNNCAAILPNPNIDLEFLYQSLLNIDFKYYVQDGAVPSINQSVLKQIIINIPKSIKEQQKIASILENVDNNIYKTQKIIEKYEMMKQGLMNDLFTKGIDENGNPANGWNFKKLIDLCLFIKDGTHGSFKDYENGIPMLSAKDIKSGKIILDNNPRTISKSDYDSIHSKYKIQKGDVLLTIVGSIGRTAIVNTDKIFTLQRSVAIIRPKEDVNSIYLCYYLNSSSFQKALELAVNASAQGGVYLGSLNDIEILIPKDSAIQLQIARKLKSIDNTIKSDQKYLNKLEKIKTGLMQDLLTGKVRVKT